MLKSHRACIDLEKNVLKIQGQEIEFLPEHELPEKARAQFNPAAEELRRASGPQTNQPSIGSSNSRFPGSGSALGSAPQRQAQNQSQFPVENIRALTDLGATREQAIRYLEEAGGNVDVAASLLFG